MEVRSGAPLHSKPLTPLHTLCGFRTPHSTPPPVRAPGAEWRLALSLSSPHPSHQEVRSACVGCGVESFLSLHSSPPVHIQQLLGCNFIN